MSPGGMVLACDVMYSGGQHSSRDSSRQNIFLVARRVLRMRAHLPLGAWLSSSTCTTRSASLAQVPAGGPKGGGRLGSARPRGLSLLFACLLCFLRAWGQRFESSDPVRTPRLCSTWYIMLDAPNFPMSVSLFCVVAVVGGGA